MKILSLIVHVLCVILWSTSTIVSKEKAVKISNAICAIAWGIWAVKDIIHLIR